MSKIKSFAGLIVAFIVAIGCDRWVGSLRAEVSQTVNTSSFLWQAGLANLLLAVALLLLTGYVLFWSKRSKLMSAVFLLIGLFVTFASALEMTFVSTLPPIGVVEFLTPGSHVLFAAAFLAILGLAGFVLPARSTT